MQRVSIAQPSTFIHFALVVLLVIVVIITYGPKHAGSARAFFVFGDSLVDSGNNNYLATTARADTPPYGIDSTTHRPSGRFSNGLNFPDVIGEAMGLKSPLPYLDPSLDARKLLDGANFASAGIGILNDTGSQFVGILRMFRQFELFEAYQARMCALIGKEKARELVNDAMVLVTIGGNDFVNNYFLPPISLRRSQFNIHDFCSFLVSEYRKILMRLYELGARRVLVTGTGPLGCVPGQLALLRSKIGECVEEPQQASKIYNSMLFDMIKTLNKDVGSDAFVAVNAFDMNLDLINNPQKFGFRTSKIACCGQGPYNGLGTCNIISHLCPNRNEYVFWDAFHPTERANKVIVDHMKHGFTKYMYPMNLSSMMAIDSRKT